MKHKPVHFITADINVTGGVEKVTEILSKEFSQNIAPVHIHSLYTKKTQDILIAENIHGHGYSLQYPDNEPSKLRKILRYLKNGISFRNSISSFRKDENLIFQGFYLAIYAPFLIGKSRNITICEHNTYSAVGSHSMKFRKILYKFLPFNLVVLSDGDAEYYRSLGVKNVLKIYNPSPFEILPPKLENNKTIISLGRFSPQKRFDLMISIIAPILKEFPEWRLTIQGDGDEMLKIINCINENQINDQIQLLPLGSPLSLYKNGSIFVMTSLYEGLPMTIIEALSWGIPVISFSCSDGIAELIDDGHNGYLIPMNDIESFQSNLKKLMYSPESLDKMSLDAKKTSQKFARHSVMSGWKKIIR